MKKRMANMEALRLLAMFMVVVLHYLSKGGYLSPLTEEMNTNGYVAWFVEAFAIVAVNVYMLISGYFLVESGFKFGRLIELVCQVLFYTIGVPLVLIITGVIPASDITVYKLLQYLFPTQMLHYWFVSAYILMYLFLPVLSAAAKALSKEQLRNTVLLLLFTLSISKSVLPVKLELDNLGYDAIWFMCVFLVAAYIRLYGIPFFNNGLRSILCYAGSCLGIFAVAFGVRMIYMNSGSLDNFIQATYSYNHILALFGSVAIFYGFYHWNISGDSAVGKLICKVAPYTFGVYLLHEQVELRYLWTKWCGANPDESVGMMLLRLIISAFIVLVVGIIIDMIRNKIFSVVKGFGRRVLSR